MIKTETYVDVQYDGYGISFICPFCSANEDESLVSAEINSGGGMYRCYQCNAEFDINIDYSVYISVYHNGHQIGDAG